MKKMLTICDYHRLAVLIALAANSLVFCGCQQQLMPTPNLYLGKPSDVFDRVPSHFRSNQIDVLYYTDRVPLNTKDGHKEYGYERSPSAAFGSCIIRIGKDVAWDTLVKNSQKKHRLPSLPLRMEKITEHARFPETPFDFVELDGKIVEDPEAVVQHKKTTQEFIKELQRRLQLTERKEAFVFVHGNFAQFEHGPFVIAQLWHFLGRQGVPIAYSWPAGIKGNIRMRYARDRESGIFTIHHLKHFLRALASCSELEKIHIIAHSWGTTVITDALRELLIEANVTDTNPHNTYKIGNLILAAPDMDLGIVRQRLSPQRFFDAMDRVTLYVSQRDLAISVSERIVGSDRRLGQLRLEDLEQYLGIQTSPISNIHIIDAKIKTDLLGHYYFYESPAVSSDLILLLRDNSEPGSTNGRPLIPLGKNFWQIDDR